MKTSTAPRARRVAQLGPDASTLRLQATRWALAQGRSLDYDAISVILGAKSEIPVPVNRWTEDDVWRLWWIDLSGWCALRGVPIPDGLATTLVTLFDFLDASGGWSPGSDDLKVLVDAMKSAGAMSTARRGSTAG